MKRQRGRGRRSGGGNNNNPNKHFESNGPDVKIRGSAQQILDKYQQYARDAQSSGDRVNAENYLQHAEHYYRVLAAMQPKEKPREERAEQQDDDTSGEGGEAKADGEQNRSQDSDSNRERGRGRGRGRNRRDREERTDESGETVEVKASDEGAPKEADAPKAEDQAPASADAEEATAEAPKPKRRTYKKRTPAADAVPAEDGDDGIMKTLSRGRKKADAEAPVAPSSESEPVEASAESAD